MTNISEGVACSTHANCQVIFRCKSEVINGKKIPVYTKSGKRVVIPIHIRK